MRIIIPLFLSLVFIVSSAFGQSLPAVTSGKIVYHSPFASRYVDARTVAVWLPEGYTPDQRYPVLYCHDGQMLFDSTTTWNRQEWGVDETFSRLIAEGIIEPCIVVAVWNNGKYRASEYFPEKFLTTVTEAYRQKFIAEVLENKPQSDRYLKFLATELKPWVDSAFSTYTDRDHTFIMGSSRGGVISLYAMSEYPDVFGGAACLSSHWVGIREHHFELALGAYNYFRDHLPSALSHKLYMDRGTHTLDSLYQPYQDFMDILVRSQGYGPGNLVSLVFEGTDHSEKAWAARLEEPVTFLLGKKKLQRPVAGKIDHFSNFPSRYTAPRNIDVWLPESYDTTKQYDVLYMHDGQMLYDASTTWNQQSWDVDDVATRLLREGKIRDFIVVGVWNAGNQRHSDYFPQKPWEALTFEEKSAIRSAMEKTNWQVGEFQATSDNYLRFMVNELKPFIDKNYKTRPTAEHTFVMGSSMGGLISMYALTQYPEVFGGAACISTHWPGFMPFEGNPVPASFLTYLKDNLKKIKKKKIYFDTGGKGLDAAYPPVQKEVDALMKKNGFSEKQWLTRYFPEADHRETDWNSRVDIPLIFLLGN